MDRTQKLLNYWYNLEFSPFWPEKNKGYKVPEEIQEKPSPEYLLR